MKKLTLFFSVIVVLLCSCSEKGTFSISGTASDSELEGKYVYLMKEDAEQFDMANADSAVIKSGKFTFKGIQETPAIYRIFLQPIPGEMPLNGYLQIQQGNFVVSINKDNINIGGSPENDAFQKNNDEIRILSDKMQAIQEHFASLPEEEQTEEALDKAQKEYSGIMEEMKKINLDYMKNNINNLLGIAAFEGTYQMYEMEDLKEVINNLEDSFKTKEPFVSILNNIEILNKVAVGAKFTDVTLKDTKDNSVSLSDYVGKGKYVLIDFWASWCGPCIREMPTLLEAYGSYGGDKFEIVGVSLDEEKDDWIKMISDLKMSWPQMSDLKGWNSEAAGIYGVRSIPHTILIDPDGIIIEKNLRGKLLLEKLKEVIK